METCGRVVMDRYFGHALLIAFSRFYYSTSLTWLAICLLVLLFITANVSAMSM